jgi:hypothetical protein
LKRATELLTTTGISGSIRRKWTNTPTDVLVTHNWSEAATRLAAGGKVLFMPGNADLDPAKCPPMKNVPVFWNIQMTVRPPQNPTPKFDAMLGLLCDTNHPALAEFPTEANCDWQWTPARQQRALGQSVQTAPRNLKPIVWAIDDWNRNWRLGVIFECNVGTGRLLVSAINLDNERGGPGIAATAPFPARLHGRRINSSRRPRSRRSKLAASGTILKPNHKFDPDLNDGTITNSSPKN